VAGLGNIGKEYQHTRHNIGFDILDALADASNINFEDKRYGMLSSYRYRGRSVLLLKPSTFMNLSGKAVRHWLQKESIPLENLLVLVDDLALPLGTVRIRPSGGDGGHNGLHDIIDVLGHNNFSRLRFGIRGEFPYGQQVNYVLGNWEDDELTLVKQKIPLCHEIIHSFITTGIQNTMNEYNRR